MTKGVTVLRLHEIESVLCDQKVIASVAEHFGKKPMEVWDEFLNRLRKEFRGQTFNGLVARRVRSRIGDLLDGAFTAAQIVADPAITAANHSRDLSSLDLPAKAAAIFAEESKRVTDALADGGSQMLAILPGKHLLTILAGVLGLSKTSELTSLIVRALDKKLLKKEDPLFALGEKIEAALLAYLAPRRT